MSTVLITGATGFLGREVVRALLARDERLQLIALIRASDDASLDRRCTELRAILGISEAARLSALRGDVTQPNFGLSESARATLVRSVDRVVHVAASTRFDLPLAEARIRNVDGTRNVLELCRKLRAAGREARLDHVSTAYVAGLRTDLVAENDASAPPGFRNSYEQSKFEGELLCRQARCELPLVIHRPSIVVGSSATGTTTRYHGFYEVLASAVRVYGPWKTILTRVVPLPFDPDCTIDLVPVDYVACAIATLFERREAAGRCYHLAAGPEGASSVRDLVARAARHFDVRAPSYVRRGGVIWGAARTMSSLTSAIAPRLHRKAALILPYTWDNPRFDTANARAAGLQPPSVADYLRRVLDYAYATDFGRRESGRASDTCASGAVTDAQHSFAAAGVAPRRGARRSTTETIPGLARQRKSLCAAGGRER